MEYSEPAEEKKIRTIYTYTKLDAIGSLGLARQMSLRAKVDPVHRVNFAACVLLYSGTDNK